MVNLGLAWTLSHEWAQMPERKGTSSFDDPNFFKKIYGSTNIEFPLKPLRRRGGRSKRCSSRGWAKKAPRTRRERKRVRDKCGDYCFLGKDMSFPVCSKNTRKCRRDRAGVCAAKYRADQHDYKEIARKARRILEGGKRTTVGTTDNEKKKKKRGRVGKSKRGGKSKRKSKRKSKKVGVPTKSQRHTNFEMESIEQTFNGQPGFAR